MWLNRRKRKARFFRNDLNINEKPIPLCLFLVAGREIGCKGTAFFADMQEGVFVLTTILYVNTTITNSKLSLFFQKSANLTEKMSVYYVSTAILSYCLPFGTKVEHYLTDGC